MEYLVSQGSPELKQHPREAERLEALHATGLLDSAPDPRMDGLLDLAVEMFDAPMALFSLVDRDRQWFKARKGMPVSETPRTYSFCSHAIAKNDYLEVSDAWNDERFRANPLVTGSPFIRFYAGAPVYSAGGFPLGTFCILDTRSRHTTDRERSLLLGFAKLTSALIDPNISDASGRSAEPRSIVLHPREFLKEVDRLLSSQNHKELGLGIIKLRGLKRLQKTRGFDFCEKAVSQALTTLLMLAPGVKAVTRVSFDQFTLISKQYSAVSDTRLTDTLLERALYEPLAVDGMKIDVQCRMLWTTSLEGISSSKQIVMLAHEMSTSSIGFPANQRLKICDDQFVQSVVLQDAVRNDFSAALERGDITFAYQPKVDAMSLGIVGFEALMRWQHPTIGFIAPPKIVRAAMDLGLEYQLLDYTLRKILCQMAIWKTDGLLNNFNVAINLSAADLSSPGFPALLGQLLEEYGIDGTTIELELLENGIVGDLERCVANIKASKNLGVRFAIDDFGTGFSSLSYLHRIPADTLKIDKSFIDKIEADVTSSAIVDSIVGLGRITGMKSVAEGVETRSQAIMMKALQCDYLQGYYFDRPLKAEVATELLRSGKQYA